MLHKLFNYLGAGLLAIGVSQCKCARKPVYDTTKLELQWEEEGQPLAVSGLDVAHSDGITCYVPSEEAVYFWNHDGKCGKFTIPLEGDLTWESIADLNPYIFYPRFAFAAGPKEKQVLYLGWTDDRRITICKYESGGWQQVSLTQAGGVVEGLTACTFETGNHLHGCLALNLRFKKRKNSFNRDDYKACFLSYNPATESLSSLLPLQPRQGGQNFTTATEVDKGKILLVEQQTKSRSKPSLSLLSISDTPSLAPQQVINETAYDRWESFSLRAEGELPISMPIFTTYEKNNIPKFYKLDKNDQVVSVGSLSIESVGNSLVLPFSNVVYVVTTVKEDGKKKIVSYKGKLASPAKKPDKKS